MTFSMFIDQRTPFFPAPPKNAQQETIWKSLGIDPIVASSTALLCFSLLSAAWLVHSNHSFHGDWGPPLSSGGWTVIRPNPTHLISSPWFRHELVMQIWLIKSEGKSLEEFSLRISLKLKKKKKTKMVTLTFLFLCLGFSVWAGNCDPHLRITEGTNFRGYAEVPRITEKKEGDSQDPWGHWITDFTSPGTVLSLEFSSGTLQKSLF